MHAGSARCPRRCRGQCIEDCPLRTIGGVREYSTRRRIFSCIFGIVGVPTFAVCPRRFSLCRYPSCSQRGGQVKTAGRSWRRFLFIALILAATFGLLRAREREEVLPPRSNLSNFPYALHQWYGRDLQTTEEMTKSLGPGEFLFRDYVDADTRSAAGLLIAYFPSQRTGDTI